MLDNTVSVAGAMERLLAAASSFARADSRAHILRSLLTEGIDVLGARAGIVELVAPESAHGAVDAIGFSAGEIADARANALEASIGNGKPEWIESRDAWAARFSKANDSSLASGAFAVVPLIAHDKTIGALGLACAEERPFDDAQRSTLAILAMLGAQQLEHLRLEEEARARARLAEEANAVVEASADWYRRVTDAMPPIMWTYTPRGAIDYVSSRWFDYTGESIDHTRPRGWRHHLHPEDLRECLRRIKEAHRSSGTWEMEFRLRGIDGGYRWFLARSMPVTDDTGRVARWVGTAIDVDAQKRAADTHRFLADVGYALTTSFDVTKTLENVARLTTRRIADFCIIDLKQHGEMRRLAVASASPLEDARVRELARFTPRAGGPEEDRAVLFTDLDDATLAKLAGSPDEQRLLGDLGARTAIVAPMRVRDELLGGITLLSTERRFTETDRAAAEALAARASTAIDNARLYVEAHAANAEKDRFLAMISHELRGPLAAINMWAHVLRSGAPDAATQARALEAIRVSASAQSKLIDDLLDLSRSITGKMRVTTGPLDVGGILRAAVDAARPVAQREGVSLHEAFGPCGPALADPSRTLQIFGNLLSNAIKFTPRGGRVHVTLEEALPRARITVRDTGRGIAEELLPHVFDPFRQGQGDVEAQGGLGLGLAVARRLARLQGGEIHASSEGIGRGATFVVELPLASDSDAILPSVPDARLLGGISIVIVDDDEDVREGLALTLTGYGARARCAASAEEALRAFDAEVPDLLLADLAMPEVDGCELIHRVRERDPERGANVVAAALTAYADAATRNRARDAGFQHHISKSIDPNTLVAEIAALVGRA